jgi:hypothetical protein
MSSLPPTIQRQVEEQRVALLRLKADIVRNLTEVNAMLQALDASEARGEQCDCAECQFRRLN